MKILENMDRCYGCAACANVCSVDAITMQPGVDGFLYPAINEDTCVNCGACKRVCPQINASYENAADPSVYAIMASDEIREKSASGGVFSLLAEYVFKKNGYVCGAAFADDFRSVKHLMIHDPADLDKLRRSKYVQSENGDIYKQVKGVLDTGAWVLFVGTPCQCAALKAFLRKPYDTLILVDLICHGTPSPLAWNKFLDEVSGNKKIEDINFQYKGLVGWSTTIRVQFKNGEDYVKRSTDDPYLRAYNQNIISRKSCGTCQFARVPRQGDITIGDFWGINFVDKSLNDKKGTSVVLANTKKGGAIVDALRKQGRFKTHKEVSFFDAFSQHNANVTRFPQEHPGHDKFFAAMEEGKSFQAALVGAQKVKCDIALLGVWYGMNYGSVMTNYALYQLLEDMGYNVAFADVPEHLWPAKNSIHRNPLSTARRFGNKHFKLFPKYINRTDLKKMNDRADIFVVGSDQLWNYKLCRSAETYFFLDFVDENKKKIAYGTSFGHNSWRGSNTEHKKAGYYLQRFDAISVREDYAVEMCKNEFGVDAVQVLDPVFMLNRQHYLDRVAESSLQKNAPKGKYLLAYILDPNEEKQAAAEYAAHRLGLKLICVPNAWVTKAMRENWRLPIKENIDMEDWLYYFKNAEMVVTDSFHGTCFSVIFERPFISIVNKGRGAERFHSLLSDFGLLDCLVESPKEIMTRETLFAQEIDYDRVNEKIAKMRAESTAWLQNALSGEPRPNVYSAYDITDERIDQVVKQLADKEAALLKQIAAQGKQIAAQNERIKEQEEQIAAQRDQMTSMRHQNGEEDAKRLNDRVREKERSFSWLITKTLGKIKVLVKKCLKKAGSVLKRKEKSSPMQKNEPQMPIDLQNGGQNLQKAQKTANSTKAEPPKNAEKHGQSSSVLENSPDFVKIRLLATLLRDYGIKHVVLSPGGRDVPLIRMFEYNESQFVLHRVTDERSAAYFAMGIAAQLHQPVACVCTSGTAASNYLPAVTEAFYTGVPLIVITADRREVYHDQGEDQTIPQRNIYRDVVKKAVTLPEGSGYHAEYQTRRDISDCILESTHNGFGPVHINISIENISIGSDVPKEHWKLLPRITPHLQRVGINDGGDQLLKWVDALKKSRRILVVYGQNAYPTEKQRRNIERFASKYNCVIVTDFISNLDCAYSLKPYNMLQAISSDEFNEQLSPDILITVGGKRLMNDPLTPKVRKGLKNIRHWSVTPDGKVKDFYFRLTSVLELSQDYFFEWFADHAGDITNDGVYYGNWRRLTENYTSPVVEKFTSNYIQSKFMPSVPSNSMLHLGVGQSFYDSRKYSLDKTVEVFCNMGTNGIDGCTSTFMGQCAVEKNKLCFLLVGDLSFFYDMNSIWNKQLEKNVRILMVNNNGTGLLRRHKLKGVSSVHNTEARGWVESTGFEYISARSKEEFNEKLKYFISDKPQKALFFEVFCD